jgi:hypothetical protein
MICRDIPVYAAQAIPCGIPMCSGPVATEVNNGRAIVATGTSLANIIGVTNEAVTAANALAVLATGYETYAKIIINPFAIWLTQYDTGAAYDVALTSADATGKTITTADLGNNNQTGYWSYITSTGSSSNGFGNLFCAGAATTTTVLTAVTDYDDDLKANAIGDTTILMFPRYGAGVVGGNIDLVCSSATAEATISGQVAGAGSGAAIVLENYIVSSRRPMEPLVISRHSGKNYAAENPKFYADVFMPEHLLATGGCVNNRVIT